MRIFIFLHVLMLMAQIKLFEFVIWMADIDMRDREELRNIW